MEQLLCHLLGDFIFQNEWLATNKTKNSLIALIHVSIYTACFLFVTNSLIALAIIGSTHFFIDRFRLAKYWMDFVGIGYSKRFAVEQPVWLLIIIDNSFHLIINYIAISYWG